MAGLLSPISYIYGHITGKRMRKRPSYASTSKVICIGNLTAGGTGKTPTAIAIKQLIPQKGAVYLSRGYGGKIEGPELVTQEHTHKDVGDEPQLLARYAPTIISSDRIKGAKLAEEHGAKYIIMDDGLQNPHLFKDIRICVIDGPRGFGNMQCMPSGPLRQPLALGLLEVDAFVIIGQLENHYKKLLPKATPVFEAKVTPYLAALPDSYKENNYIAFCGIGYPEKFKATLESIKLNLKDFKAFSDHHNYTSAELSVLSKYAAENNCRLITTEKDFVRIGDGPWKSHIDVLPISLKFKAEKQLISFLEERLSGEL